MTNNDNQDQDLSKDDRIAFLTSKVSELEHALRDAKLEIRYLRLENRCLTDQVANANPSLYSSSLVLDWIEEDMLPMQTYTEKPEPVPVRRSRPSSNPSLSPAVGRGKQQPKVKNSPNHTPNPQPIERPISALGRYAVTNPPSSPPRTLSSSKPQQQATMGLVKHASVPSDVVLDANGLPKLPVTLGILTIVSLGTLCTEDGYCNERNVFPIGYTVHREFMSCVSKDASTVYTCTILKGQRGPIFQITAADAPDAPHTGNSSTEVWTQITKKANLVRGREIASKISGPEYYGLNNLAIVSWMQKLDGIDKMSKYHFQDIVVTPKPSVQRAAPVPSRVSPPLTDMEDPMDLG